MKSYSKIILIIGAYIFIGAFITFILDYKTSAMGDSIIISVVFTTVLFLSILFIQRFFRKKLSVFHNWQALIISSLLYIIALTFALLSAFIVYTISVTHRGDAMDIIGRTLIGGFTYIITLPFKAKSANEIFTQDLREIFMTFSGLLFLIGLFSVLTSYIESHWKETRQRQLIADAELKALRAQMDPHFLFNSINTIVSAVQENPAQAEKLLIRLSELLRYLFSDASKENLRLKDEITFTKNYFSLMKARFPDKLNVTWKENFGSGNMLVPALLFQPLVENALKHAWKDKSKPFNIDISILKDKNYLNITIHDNGAGIPAKRLKKLPIKNHALANLKDRIKLTYQNKGSLKIISKEKEGTTVKIKIPAAL